MKSSDVAVLVVDDNLELLESYTNLFTVLGYKVWTAVHGQLALEVIERETIDIVFTDVRMPVMDGFELLLNIRKLKNPRPHVLVTSGFSDYSVETLLDAGASGFLGKPLNAVSIQKIFSTVLMKPEARWSQPVEASAGQSLVRSYKTFDEMIDSREVSFGSGGFFLKQERPPPPSRSPVGFRFEFEQGTKALPLIEGVGVIQWTRGEVNEGREKGVGVEITYLKDSCRSALSTWLFAQNFNSYIPLN